MLPAFWGVGGMVWNVVRLLSLTLKIPATLEDFADFPAPIPGRWPTRSAASLFGICTQTHTNTHIHAQVQVSVGIFYISISFLHSLHIPLTHRRPLNKRKKHSIADIYTRTHNYLHMTHILQICRPGSKVCERLTIAAVHAPRDMNGQTPRRL